MKKKNILMIALSLCLIGVIAVGGTLAYFTDNSSASNAFTMGHVAIHVVDETNNDALAPDAYEGHRIVAGTPGADDEDGITYTNVVPGDVIDKSVGVEVLEGSEKSRIAVKVTVEDISTRSGAQDLYTAILADYDEANWEAVVLRADPENEASAIRGIIFSYKADVEYVPENTDGNKYVAFDHFMIPETWGNEMGNATFKINVQAAAVQAENVPEDYLKTESNWESLEEYVAPAAEG